MASYKKIFFYMFLLIVMVIIILNRFVLSRLFPYSFSMFKARDLILQKSEINPLMKAFKVMVDVHLEDTDFQHTLSGNHINLHLLTDSERKLHIAIGGGITSASLLNITVKNVSRKFIFFHAFLPSFCKTASTDYKYHFYLSFDVNDTAFTDKNILRAFVEAFELHSHTTCRHVQTYLHLVKCNHFKKPAWAQNDAMLEAYLDGIEYFYRVNDDSILITSGWAGTFINQLGKFSPENVGVVGPNHHGGNTGILTYDFVHRTHIDIFGYYYPRLFTDWFADNWITEVYKPDHMQKLLGIKLSHTMSLGRRYEPDWSIEKNVVDQIKLDKDTLSKYISSRYSPVEIENNKVISMSLYGNAPRMTVGAIRNAQILPIYFPGWKLRIYTPNPENVSAIVNGNNDHNDHNINVKYHSTSNSTPSDSDLSLNGSNEGLFGGNQPPIPPVPDRIIHILKRFGAEIVFVNQNETNLPPSVWSYLVADDASVDYFVIRKPHFRISAREFETVQDFIRISSRSAMVAAGNSSKNISDSAAAAAQRRRPIAFHCIRDALGHVNMSIVPGLWGGNRKLLSKLFSPHEMKVLLGSFFGDDQNFRISPSVSSSQSSSRPPPSSFSSSSSSTQPSSSSSPPSSSSSPASSNPMNLLDEMEYRFLNDFLWKRWKRFFICHDSVTKSDRSAARSVDFPENSGVRNYLNIVGLEFNRHHLPDQLEWLDEVKSLT